MKHILLPLLLPLLVVFAANARRTPGDKVGVSFDNTVYDFGTLYTNSDPVHHKFPLTVTGTTPVAIIMAKPSCGCTASEYPKQPLKPGDKASISITFNPNGQFGEINKTVRVMLKNANGKSEQLTLKIKGTVLER